MLATSSNKIRFDLIIAISASLVFITRVVDHILMFIARPYLLSFLNDIKTKKVNDEVEKITWLAFWTSMYSVVVFHLLISILAFIVLFNKKYKPYKREFFWAYLMIVVISVSITFGLRLFHVNT